MANKLSIIIACSSGSFVKRMSIPRAIVFLFIACLGCIGSLLGYWGVDYYLVKREFDLSLKLKERAAAQAEEIFNQRLKIKKFAADINELKSSLVDLHQFETKIRIIANINQGSTGENFFGMGGSIPEDLDPRSDLARKHNYIVRQMHDHVNQLNLVIASQEKDFEILLSSLEQQRNLLASTPAIRPSSGWVTSSFGYRISPFTGMKELHQGLDIANRKGTPILATAEGVVSFSGQKGSFGNVVIVDHGHGIKTLYAHIDTFLKKVGEKVERGDVIAQMGSSGRSTGPHLHYEVRLHGIQVNPNKYIIN